MSKYTQQADKFMEETGTTLKTEWLDYAPFFDGYKESRHIFRCTLKRKGKSFRFKFGQSIIADAEEPKPYDVLTCLTKRDPESFENFCFEYGYSDDSIKAHKIYKAVVREWRGVERIFGDVLEKLQGIQQEKKGR